MAVYFVTGKLGSGKTLCCVGKIQEYLNQGRQVATNLDLHLEHLQPQHSKQTVYRLPDKPRLEDLQAIGQGCVEEDESRYGLLVLDELGTWFNSRNWRDKERLPVIDWFLHARKKHWDIFFIVQDIESIDGQLINALCEHYVNCSRTDRLTIPIIGSMIKFLGFQKVLPKIHIASVYYGMSKSALRVDRWVYRAKNLYKAYNTAQIFRDEIEIDYTGEVHDVRALYTVLSSYYLHNVELRNRLQKELSSLGGGDKKPSSRQDRRFFNDRSLIQQCALGCLMLLASAYGFARKQDQSQTSNPLPVTISQSKSETTVPVVQPVKSLETDSKTDQQKLDYFQKITRDAMVRVSSFYSDGFTIKAIMQIGREENQTSITLDDARALGYVATVNQKMLRIAKDGYEVQVQVP